jgi:hypothetical protein
MTGSHSRSIFSFGGISIFPSIVITHSFYSGL